MSRVRMVTRTIEGINAKCLVYANSELKEQEIHVPKMEEKKVEAYLRKHVFTDPAVSLVRVNALAPENECYGMLEVDFLKYAKKLDPETRKAIETEAEAEPTATTEA